jgi:hypothetical protein
VRHLLQDDRVRRAGNALPEPIREALKRLARPNRSVIFSARAPSVYASKLRFRLRLRDTDVFLVGHPKSGNTWLAYMLAVAQAAGDPERRINVASVGNFIPAAHRYEVLHVVRSRGLLQSYERLANPRIFRNEEPVCPDLYPRTIYLVRDPRSVLVSYFHHYKAEANDSTMILDDFVAAYLSDMSSVAPTIARWDLQVLDWLDRVERQPVAIVKYEDLHASPETKLAELATFARIPVATDALNAAVERGRFEALREEERRHGAEAEGFRLKASRGRFYRSGRIDGWREELSPAARTSIEEEFRPTMDALGYLATPPEATTSRREQ